MWQKATRGGGEDASSVARKDRRLELNQPTWSLTLDRTIGISTV